MHLWSMWSFNCFEDILWVYVIVRNRSIFIKWLSTSAVAQGAPLENIFQAVLGEGDQAGPDCVGGFCTIEGQQRNLC